MAVEIFDGRDSGHNDEAYLKWIKAHPDGYVVNTNSRINPGYMVLHRSSCDDVTGEQKYEPGAYTQRQYAKVCAQSREELSQWLTMNGRPDGSFSSEECRCLAGTE